MVREAFGPYSDPQHPYFYEEEDVWMAPGFINQFYEVSYFVNLLLDLFLGHGEDENKCACLAGT